MSLQDQLLELERQTKKNQEEIAQITEKFLHIKATQLLPLHLVGCTRHQDFESLKLLFESELWPIEYMIGNTDSAMAKVLVDIFLPLLADKQILDFGCGDGTLIAKASEQGVKKAIGYDVQKHPSWHSHDQLTYTDEWDVVKSNAPYDIIVLYDVIDHIQGGDKGVKDTLLSFKELLAPEGQVHIHCHPWISRQGGHLKTNRAYAHLVFHETEIEKLGITGIPTTRLIHPIPHYESWFKSTGFRILRRNEPNIRNVESFFTDVPLVTRRIKENWVSSWDENLAHGWHFPPIQLQGIDYVLVI